MHKSIVEWNTHVLSSQDLPAALSVQTSVEMLHTEKSVSSFFIHRGSLEVGGILSSALFISLSPTKLCVKETQTKTT